MPVHVEAVSGRDAAGPHRGVGDRVAYTGLASSSGGLSVPDLGVGADVTSLLSSTNRLRVWYAGPVHYRVDRITPAAETDTYRNGYGTWTWDSDHGSPSTPGTPRRSRCPAPRTRCPEPGPAVARPGAAEQLVSIAPQRIAGRAALGLLWRPKDKRTLVGQVKVWADEKTGLPSRSRCARSAGRAARSARRSWTCPTESPPPRGCVSTPPPSATVDNGEVGPDQNLARFVLPKTPRRAAASAAR